MGARQRTANDQAYPRALETAEERFVAERRAAVSDHGGSSSTANVSTNDRPSSARTLRGLLSALRLRRRQDAAESGKLTIDPGETAHVPLPDDTVGFGLSGGGIRSATFTLGIFQALAELHLVRKIDFISTVSGGGYFGAFLGRLFTRPWIRGVEDVECVLRGIDPQAAPAEQQGWGPRVFRWLRDNGRYLAPRGSGDVVILGAILLRNWVAIQVVLVTTVLALFVGLQLGRMALERVLGLTTAPASAIANILVCDLPGATFLWWSPWVVVALVPFIAVAVPAGWAYWFVVRRHEGRRGIPPYVGLLATCAFGVAGTLYYRSQLEWHPGWFTGLLSWVPSNAGAHRDRLIVSLATLAAGALTLLYWLVGELTALHADNRIDGANLLRSRLTRALKSGLVAAGVVLAWSLVDTVGGTIYELARTSEQSLTHWAMGLFSVFAGIGAFGRQLAMLLAPNKPGARPGISASVLSWIAAGIVATTWILAINVGSQVLAWEFNPPREVPPQLAALSKPASPQLLGADHLVVGAGDDGLQVRAASAAKTMCVAAPPVKRYGSGFTIAVFVGLVLLSLLFGHTRTFANMSSIHAFYAARLTRTYLGASNESRLDSKPIPVTDTTPGDDYAGQAYWHWPGVPAMNSGRPPGARPYVKGGPLHIVNTTINETLDARTGVQNQDRKGTALAVGPCGLSVGIRHHLVSTGHGVKVSPAEDTRTHRVFSAADGAETPDPLSLGRWTSISGAAFSAAAGANTTVPIAILAGLFNVRLGYWWDSGTVYHDGWFERALPVQAALFAETFARTRGTAGRLWNLSDGGHFENMGGYELIRRRLPIIVIVDAEADPDYTFEGLADLIRKARLDFDAEITFLAEDQLSGTQDVGGRRHPSLPESVREYFGDLEALRRGKWTNEEVPFPVAPDNKTFAIEVDRGRVSRAHAALARVSYFDNGDAAWLVYVKATLMGDEPEDVAQYHRAHPAFPQETTADQFFDERQWESYRRLGLHLGHRVLTTDLFGFLENNPA